MTDNCDKIKKLLCCIEDPVFPNPYQFQFGTNQNRDENNIKFQSNFIRTSKYRWYTFLPKALILQFHRLANVYFLFIGILQSIPAISPLGPLTAWAPLIIVLAISMARQGYEDYQRYKSDKAQNHESETHVIRNNQLIKIQWSQVVVGDICYVTQKQLFPADLILISSQKQDGNAFIETASLDGQKNLKIRSAFSQTLQYNHVQKFNNIFGSIQCNIPDKHTQNFYANLTFNQRKILIKKQKQLLFRGTRLMNTKWIYGLAVYTGRNTKIMLNSVSQSQKMSQIQQKVNIILIFILIAQFFLCFIIAICNTFFFKDKSSTLGLYIPFDSNQSVSSLIVFFSYFVLINTMIPISLIVSMQIVKMSQSYFIDKDQFMVSLTSKRSSLVRSSSLNQQLGQIQHIFSDKTGTLTTNKMQFKIAVIGRRLFGDLGLIFKDPDTPPQTQIGFSDSDLKKILQKGPNKLYLQSVKGLLVKNKQKTSSINFTSMHQLATQYLHALSMAHEVIAQHDQKGNIVYQGPSPDQVTLVQAAKQMGFQFVKSNATRSQILLQGQIKSMQQLQVFPFSSDRKRMSIIVKDQGLIKMYIKGADNIVKSRLSKDNVLNLDSQLEQFSKIGLRTLLIAMRIISQQEYKSFRKKINNLPSQDRQQAFQQLVNELENDLYLIGATAVLDRLQDQVPETIRDLLRANIKVWMLTGDKMETAENIAWSCNLIQNGFDILRYTGASSQQAVRQKLKKLRIKAQKQYRSQQKMCLVIQGTQLPPIFSDIISKDHFIAITQKCQSVVCCRLLPSQKADIVKVVRQKLNKITLAIGDGSNDVPMIKAAHIGVGLYGQEGMGAVQACDYALPQFRMLWRLLLVHGRWNYVRISQMILYFFYKNMLFTLPQFLFAFYCGFSGQTIFDDYYIALFNLIFTALPLVIRAIFEQDIYFLRKIPQSNQQSNAQSANNILDHKLKTNYQKYIPHGYELNKYIYRIFPKAYFVGQQNLIFNFKNFSLWILEGVLESILIFFFCIYVLDQSISFSGNNSDMWLVGLTIYTAVMVVVTFKLATHTKFWSGMLFVSIIFLSLGLYIAYMWISNYTLTVYLQGTAMRWYTTGQTYFLIIFCICLILVLDGVVLSYDTQNSSIIHRMRTIIEQQKQCRKSQYQKNSIAISLQTNKT